MMFDLFSSNPNAHLKRASMLLQEAHMARLEHQAAAEHHTALARMYSERVRRLEAEVYRPQQHVPDTKPISTAADERPPLYSLDGNRRTTVPTAA